MHISCVLASLALTVAAAPAAVEMRAAAPSVTIKNGTVVGSSSNGVDSFKGIPFARPPTGQLRLKPPMPITKTFGTIQATGTPTSCPQFASQDMNTTLPDAVLGQLTDSPLVQTASSSGEDCLTLNVQRPSTASTKKLLPVLFWIYGGGFESGSTQTYDGSNLITKSVSLGQPIIYVAVNYRLGGFGFLAGKELQSDGSTNLGLRDQRLGLEWVAENIKKFGGDPNRVTIWGESAGSISVYDQLLINNGDNKYRGKPLYIAAIMDSGSAVPTTDVATQRPQAIFDTVVQNAGCSSASNKLSCLRSLPYQQYLNAANSVPGIFSYRSLDLSYLPRFDPHDSFFPRSPGISSSSGIAQVPLIIGDQEDEGPLFALVLSNVTTTSKLVTYLLSYFPEATRADIQGLVDTYPTDPSAGSPFRTGLANELYPQFKRIAAILGDITFTLTRRAVLTAYAQSFPSQPLYSYLSSYFHGTPFLGTFHGSDIIVAYNPAPFPEAFNAIATYYISFVNHQDPNAITTAAPLVTWPRYNKDAPMLLNFNAATNGIIPDNFRTASYNYLQSRASVLAV